MRIAGLTNAAQGANTGKNTTPLQPQLIRGSILVPYGWTMAIAPGDTDATIVANLQAALLAVQTNVSYVSRGHYIGPYETYEDKMTAPTVQTLGYGKEVETDRGRYNDEFIFDEGGIDYHKSVLTFRGKHNQYKRLDIDLSGNVQGACTYDTTGKFTGIQGFALSRLYPHDRKNANKTTEMEYRIAYSLRNSAEYNENLCIIETGVDMIAFVENLGVQDVAITPTGAMVAHVVDCIITAEDGGINLALTLPSMMVAASFVFTNLETGSTAVTLTSVAVVGNKVRFTFAAAGAGWVLGNHVQIALTDVTTLATAGFKYYETLGVNIASVVMV